MTTGRINQVAFVAVRRKGLSLQAWTGHTSSTSERELPAAISNQGRFITKLLVCLHLQSLLGRQSYNSEWDHVCIEITPVGRENALRCKLRGSYNSCDRVNDTTRALTPHELAFDFDISNRHRLFVQPNRLSCTSPNIRVRTAWITSKSTRMGYSTLLLASISWVPIVVDSVGLLLPFSLIYRQSSLRMDIEKYRPFFTYHPRYVFSILQDTHMCYMSCDAILRFNMIKIIIRALGHQNSRQNDQNPISGDKCAKSAWDPDKTFATLSSRASENTIRGPSVRAR